MKAARLVPLAALFLAGCGDAERTADDHGHSHGPGGHEH